MIRVGNILVPVDFSEASKTAVNYGLSFALEFDSRLTLAHIAPFDPVAYEQAKADLLELIPTDCRERLNFEIIVKAGDVRAELLAIVDEKKCDLVVMGTRGRSYFERLILGSVTDRMLRKLHVPVLTVSHLDPDKELHQPGPAERKRDSAQPKVAERKRDSAQPKVVELRRILYATDLSEGSEEGLEFSIRLARGLDASLAVAHVFQPADAVLHGYETAAFLPDYANEVRAQANEKLARTVGLVSDGRVPISTMLVDGVPYETINALASQFKMDLIVINLQNKGRLERAVLGTTAERVIRTATVPVLSLPLPATYALRWAAA
jgi:nucleotide-binding universal stress UspA family protein